jgi:SulP family sulfate permease
VPGGLPSIGLPDAALSDVPPLAGIAVSMFVVILAQSAATSRAYAARYHERLDENVDMVGLGMANLAAGLSGTFVVNGSPTKTQIADSAGGRTQLTSLTTAAVVLAVLLFLTGPLQYLPNAVLAAIVFLIGIELVDALGLRRIRRSGHVLEFAIALLTAVIVIVWGVQQGIVLAIILSVIAHLRRSYNPWNAVLGAHGSHDWHGVPVEPVPQPVPGLVVYRWGASLYFANATRFEEQITGLAAPDVRWICVHSPAIGDVDYTGGETLIDVSHELKKRGIRLVFAGITQPVRRELDRAGVTAAVGEDGYYPGVAEVLTAYRDAEPCGPRG